MTKKWKSDGRRIRHSLPPQAELNKKKYAHPPTWEQVDAFIKETGMKMYHFEKFYGIPYNHLSTIKLGRCNLASPYWHFIYERIKPTYGVGFIQDYIPGHYPIKKEKTKKILKKKEAKVVELENDIHGRVNKIK